jgi:hypothetical protein
LTLAGCFEVYTMEHGRCILRIDQILTGHSQTVYLRSWSDTSSNAGSDGCIQVYIGCGHPIQNWALVPRVNR